MSPKTGLPNLTNCIESSIQELLETESYFSEQRLIRAVAIQRMGEGIAAAHIIEQVRSHINTHPEIVPIGVFHEEPQFTTREMLELEKRLFAAIADAINETSHMIRDSIVERLLDRQLPLNTQLTADELTRNKEQRAAVMRLTTTPGGIKVLEGLAGTGKTHTLSVALQAWEKAGYHVTGMALSGVAARNLQEGSGIESDTIAMRLMQLDSRGNFARHHKRQLKRLLKGQRTYRYGGSKFRLNAKSIVIVDEAGMVGTRQMFELIKHARKAGAKLVLIGDRRQLQPIEAGGPFRPIADATSKACLEHVVRQNIEPDDPNPTWHRKAGTLLAFGDAADAIKLFAERGRFHVYENLDETMLAMVRSWSVEGIADPNNHILLASTKAAVAQLNGMCQSARLSAGFLGTDSVAVGENQFRIGDVVLFLKNSRLCHVKNGDRGVVLGFNRRTKTIAVRLLANGKTVFIPYRDYVEMQLGYAMTTHKAQGATVPSVHVLLGGPMQDRHLSYVQSTRARESTRLYVDKQNAGPKLKDLIQQMARNRPKRLAHEVLSINQQNGALDLPEDKKEMPFTRKQTPPQPKAPRPGNAINTTPQSVTGKRAKQSSVRPEKSNSPLSRDAGECSATPQSQRTETPPKRRAAQNSARPEAPIDLTALLRLPALNFEPKFKPSRRDVLDISHVTISGTTDSEVLKSAVGRYGKLPGGIVVEGEATCEFPLYSLAIDTAFPTRLIINHAFHFDTGLSAEEVAVLWHAVLDSNQATQNFGVLTQREAIGIDHDTIVAATMMRADNAVGGMVYGYDSMFDLCHVELPSYRNPFLDEVYFARWPGTLEKLCFNYLHDLKPQAFLRIVDTSFATNSAGAVTPYGTKVQAAIGIIDSDGTIATPIPEFRNLNLLVDERFPWVHQAFQHFVHHFVDFARSEPSLARSLAYAEVVMLLRRAKSANALVLEHDQARISFAARQHFSLPRFDYTLRSDEFVRTTMEMARYFSRRTDTNSFDCLMNALLGLRYATLAGDFESFLTCKKAAFRNVTHLYRQTPNPDASSDHQDLHRLLHVVLDRITNCSHDVLINNCLEAALHPARTRQERSTYLKDALRLCGTASMIEQIPATRCHWLEVTCHLDPTFDPVPGFAKARTENPSLWLPFSALNRINTCRHGETQRVSRRDEIVHAIEQLRTKQSDAFSNRLLHSKNPFVESHELLNFESHDGLSILFCAVRQEVERFNSTASETWWRQFLKEHAAHSKADASKVALLLAFELRARGLSVGNLYEAMMQKHTSNPQATLLLLDLDTQT